MKEPDENNCNLAPEGSTMIAGLDRKVNDTKPSFSPDISKPNLILADNTYRFWCPPKKYPTADNKCEDKCSEPYYTDTVAEMCVLCDEPGECFNATSEQC